MDRATYLALELTAACRHEYVAGEVFAMAGTSRAHARIVSNLAVFLHEATRGGRCAAYVTEIKVRVEAADAYVYPDAVVTCDPSDTDPYVLNHPRLVVEVTSPSTGAYDRGAKLDWYRSIPSVEEVLLVDAERRSVHRVRRGEGGAWSFEGWIDEGDVYLASVGATLSLDVLYDRVSAEPPAPSSRPATDPAGPR
jgi:Uma2 family endonuclease